MQGHMLSKLREQYIGSVFSTNCPSTYALCKKKKKNKKNSRTEKLHYVGGQARGLRKEPF